MDHRNQPRWNPAPVPGPSYGQPPAGPVNGFPPTPASPAQATTRPLTPSGPGTPKGPGNPIPANASHLASSTASAGAPPADSPWEEYEDKEGKKYWHNKITRKAQWEKPDELKTPAEREADAMPWKEYLSDGRKYYFNEKTRIAQWDMPEDYRLYLDRINAAKDPKDLFKQLLLDRGMTVNWTFEQVISETKDDERSKLMKMADRKQIFQDLQQELRRREVEERRRKQEQLFKDFYELMESTPGIDEFSSFREAADLAGKDQRWINVPERDRRQLWDDYLVEKLRRKKEAEKALRKQSMDELMKDLESDSRLDVNYTWKKFVRDYEHNKHRTALNFLDQLQVFQDFIGPLEDAVEKRYKEKKDHLNFQSRKAREAFRELLKNRWVKGEIQISTKWRDFVQKIRHEEGYKLMTVAAGSTPAELFYDFIDDLEKKFRDDKRRVKSMMKSLNLEMTSSLAFETWLTILKQHDDFAVLDQSNIHLMFTSLQSRAKRSEEKRRQRAAPAFREALKRAAATRESRWEAVRIAVLDNLKAIGVDDHLTEGDMILLFDEFKASVPDSDDEEGLIKEDEEEAAPAKERSSRSSRRGRSPSSSRSASSSRSRSRSRSRSPTRSRSPGRRASSDRHSRGKRRRDDRASGGRDYDAPPTESPSAPKRHKVSESSSPAPTQSHSVPQDVEEGELVD
eukprot:TRINITY_DN3122_c0_g1_i1.p1 TRINITY_DN3122_c0_g1~~TRINITY_DN3122_c0_g1_i1.p1  ORF type:complete len:683 (-),score=167.76 TRINITY_DN3122_c0_g1_i1:599-2647(-)